MTQSPPWFPIVDQSRCYATHDTLFGLVAFFRPGAVIPPPGPDQRQLLTQVVEEVQSTARFQRFLDVRRELADAECAVASLRLDMDAARLRAGRARIDLHGAERAVALGECERDRMAAEASAAAIEAGIFHLRGDVQSARSVAAAEVRAAAVSLHRRHGPQLRARELILADLARIAGPLLEELASLPADGGQAVAEAFGALAARSLLADAAPDEAPAP